MSGWGGGQRGCCRIPQTAAECLLFHFFFLRNSFFLSLPLHTRAWPLTQPTSPTRPRTFLVRVHHGPTLNCPQPASTVSVVAHSPSVFAISSLFPSLRLQATGSLPVLLKPCLPGEGAVDSTLSQEPCNIPCRCWAWDCSHPGSLHSTQGPYCPETLSLLSDFFMSSTIFGLQFSYMLGY